MHVVATAGHVDHGKSTLVRALTGQEPDRLAEEQRRGLTIELGYCWTSWPEVGEVAFVDVPGHERFVSTMLAGVGPVPAVLFVVAADDLWMPQAAEHLAALDVLGVRHAVVAITRCDLVDGAAVTAAGLRAQEAFARTSMRGSPIVAVSAAAGNGLEELRAALVDLVRRTKPPLEDLPARLWVDRRFTVKGAGTVVTGTLATGTIRVGDTLVAGTDPLRVRSMESLGMPTPSASAVARVAVRLGGHASDGVERGCALVEPGQWCLTRTIDVAVRACDQPADEPIPAPPVDGGVVTHIGSASIGTRCRPLGQGIWRLALNAAIPLHIGDRGILRDPGSRQMWGLRVLDPDPPVLRRRGAACARAEQLVRESGTGTLAAEVARRDIVRVSQLVSYGVDASSEAELDQVALRSGDWLIGRHLVPGLRRQLVELVAARRVEDPLRPLSASEVVGALGLPGPAFVAMLLPAGLILEDGRIRGSGSSIPADVLAAIETVRVGLASHPFAPPDADTLAGLGLGHRELAAAEQDGLLWRISPGVVLLPGAADDAARLLARLPQPFTVSQARTALQSSRRVVVPLLEALDRVHLTTRLTDDSREVHTDPTGRRG